MQDEARLKAKHYMLHGMSRDELQKIMMDVFTNADADGSGQLSRKEFLSAIKEADLGLTRKEINVLMAKVDADGDGNISYEEFAPLCFDILVEILMSEIVEKEKSPSQLEDFLQDLFGSGDPDNSGMLTLAELRELLRSADLGLTRLQIHTVLSEADEDESGFVAYRKFCGVAASMIYRILDQSLVQERYDIVQSLQQDSELLVHGTWITFLQTFRVDATAWQGWILPCLNRSYQSI